jgi:transcriptional regulator with XRE-family HTH domain
VYTKSLSAQQKNRSSNSVIERLRRYQVSSGLPWHEIAARLGISRSMIMMVLRDDRQLSAKALFRLEKVEQESAETKSAAERIVEGLIGERDLVTKIIGQGETRKNKVEIAVEYVSVKPSKTFPTRISLSRPGEEDCRKLKSLFAETLDTRLIALACLPNQFRSEGFLVQLTTESRSRVTTAALGLVIPDWRTLVTGGM